MFKKPIPPTTKNTGMNPAQLVAYKKKHGKTPKNPKNKKASMMKGLNLAK